MKSKVYSKVHWLLSLMAIVWMAFVPASMYAASVPTNVHVKDLAPISATLVWEIEGTDRHDYDIRVATSTLTSTEIGAASVGNPASVVIAENAITLAEPEYAMSGLTAGTHYYVYIRENADWDYTQSSDWAAYEFSTPCEATAELPIAANFDGSSTIPTCWSTGGNAPTVVGSPHRGESGNAVKISPTSESGSYLYSPVLASNAGAYYLTAYVYGAAGADYAIGIAATDNLLDVRSILEGKISQANTWTFIDAAIPADLQAILEGGVEYVWVFYAEASNNAVNFYVDDIEITAMPPCITPNGLSVSEVAPNSAVISWNERGTATAWMVQYSDGVTTLNAEATGNPSTLLENLAPNTSYTVRVKAVCGEESESEWTETVSLKTPCGALSELIEGFEDMATGTSSSDAPECWAFLNVNGGAYPYVYVNTSSRFVHSGSKSLYFRSSATIDAYVILPLVEDIKGKEMEFYYKDENISNSGKLYLGYMTDISSEDSFVELKEFPRSTSWEVGTAEFSAIPDGIANTARLAFKYEHQGANYYLGIDDISITTIPTCRKPSDLVLGEVGTTTAALSWTAGGDESQWKLTYGENEVIVNDEPAYTIEGLGAGAQYSYTVAIQAICSEEDMSAEYSSSISFRTQVDCSGVGLPHSENFNDVTGASSSYTSKPATAMLPDCWSVDETANAFVYVTSNSSYAVSGNGLLFVGKQGSRVDTAYVYLPTIVSDGNVIFTAQYTHESSSCGQLVIGYVTSPEDASTFVEVASPTPAGTFTSTGDILLPSNNGVIYPAIMFISYPYYYVGMDNVSITLAPSCMAPAAIAGTVKNATTVNVKITDVDAAHTAWEVAIGDAEGFNPDEATIYNVTSKDTQITLPEPLTNGNSYGIAVRAICGEEEISDWRVGANMVYTDWSGLNPDITFSTGASYPWTLAQVDGVWQATSGNAGVHNTVSTLTASFEVGDNAKATFSFDYKTGSESISWDYLVIFIDDACDNPNCETNGNYYADFGRKGGTTTVTGSYSIEFTTPGTHRVMWAYKKDGSADGGIDKAIVYNVTFSSYNCIEPTTFNLGTITENSAVLNWNATSADQYKVLLFTEAQTTIDEAAAVQSDVVTTTTKTFEGLEASTLYYAYVQSLCGEEPSAWSAVTQFHTECSAEAIPYSESFENEASLLCWNVKGEPAVVGLVSAAFEGDHAVSVQSDSVGLMLISPRFDAETLAPYVLNMAVRSPQATAITVGVIIDPSDVSTYIDLGEINLPTPNKWNEYSLSLDMLATEDYEEYASAQYLAVYIPTYKTFLFDAISVAEPAECPKPTALHVQPVGEEVVIDWTSDAANHNMQIALGDEPIFSGSVEKPYTPSGLTGNTEYKVRVQAVCDEELSSAWTPWMSFKSPCTMLPLPYSENFDDLTVPGAAYSKDEIEPVFPDCWDYSYDGSNLISVANTTTTSYISAKSGNNAIVFSGSTEAFVFLPVVSGADGRILLTFQYRQESTTSSGHFIVGYVTTPGDSTTFVGLQTLDKVSSYTPVEIVLPDMEYINAAIKFVPGSASWYAAIDDVTITQAPSCIKASNLVLDEVGTDYATISWTPGGEETEWVLTIDDVTEVINGTPSYRFDNLEPGTTYSWSSIKIQAVCSEEDSAEVYSKALSFTTAFGIPYSQSFNVASLSAANWTIMYGDVEAVLAGTGSLTTTSSGWVISTSWNGLPANHAKINIYNDPSYGTTTNSWMLSPVIDMTNVDPNSLVEFSFDFAYTDWNNADAPNDDSNQALLLLVSIDGGAHWLPTNGYEWSHTDSIVGTVSKTLGDIPTTGTNIKLRDFARFAGNNIQLAFVATTTNGDNDFHIANVSLKQIIAGCDEPTELNVVGGDRSLAISWVGNEEQASIVEVAKNSAFTSGKQIFNVEAGVSELSVSDLDASTTYFVRVKQICSEEVETAYSAVVSATTECEAITTFPWSEDFNSLSSGIPACWDNSEGSTTEDNYKWHFYASGEGGFIYFDSYDNAYGNTNFLKTPVFHSDRGLILSFKCANPDGGDYSVYVSTDGGATKTAIFTGLTGIYEWTTKEYDLSAYAGQDIMIIFKGTSNEYEPETSYESPYLYLDDVNITLAPLCYPLQGVEVPNIGSDTMDIVITPTTGHAPESYDLVISEEELEESELEDAQIINVTEATYHAQGLTPDTEYHIYVRGNCGEENGTTDWLYVSATTHPTCMRIAYLAANNITRREMDIVMMAAPGDEDAVRELVISEEELDLEELEAADKLTLTESTYHATGLTRETTYYIYARVNCGEENGASAWKTLAVTTKAMEGEECPEIGTAATTSSYVPAYYLYNYAVSEQIYTASEIGMAGTINSISFNVHSGTSTRDITIYLKHTTKSNFSDGSDWVTVSASDIVYSGNVTWTTGWNTFTLNTPFAYNGTDNLLVVMNDNTGTWQSGGPYYEVYPGNGTQALYKYQDGAAYDPTSSISAYTLANKNQIQLCISYSISPCPAIDAETMSHELTGNGTSSAIIRWGESDGDYANSYDMYYATEAVQDFTDVVPQHDSIEALSFELTELSEDTEYYVYIRTNCDGEGQSDGSSNWSDAYVFRTFANCQALSGLYVELLGKTSAQANWDATVQTPNFQYILSEEELDAEDLETAQLTEAGLVDTFAVMQDLTPGTTYYLYVANRCGEEEENHSIYVSTSFTMPAGCPAVENLEAYYQAFNAVGLKWNRGRFGEEEEWEVGIVGEESSAQAVDDSTAIIISLQPSTDYTFYVKAVCGVEDSSAVVTLAVHTNPLPSDNVIVADGEVTNSYTPVWGLWCDRPQRTQSIYPSDMLADLVGQTITGLHYVVSSGGSSAWADAIFNVNIGITDDDNLADGWTEANWNTVYTGTLSASMVEGMTVVFDTPFEYNGGNLAIEFELPEASSYSSCYFYGIAADDASRYVYGESYLESEGTVQSFLPKVEFQCVSQGTCRQAANVQATDITFNSAKLTWFPGGSEVEWAMINSDVELTNARLNAMVADTLDVMEKAYDGLTPGLFYHFYIRSLCGEGDVSDWKHLQYRTIPTCIEPVMATPLLIDADSVVLTWTSGNETFDGTYSLAYGLSDQFNLAYPETYTLIENLTDNHLTIHGLSGSSRYRVVVKAICTADDESIWSNAIDFMSACVAITNLPWMEDFEELTSDIPQCWDNSNYTCDASQRWQYNSSYEGHNGNGLMFNAYSASSGTTSTLLTPHIYTGESTYLKLSFYMKNGDEATLDVKVSIDGGETFPISLYSNEMGSDEWELFEKAFEVPDNADIVVSFKATSDWGYSRMLLDEVGISKLAVAATYYDQTCSGTAYQGHGFDIPASQVVVGENTFTRIEAATSDLMADSLYTLVLTVGESKVTAIRDTACAFSAYDNYGFHIGSVNPNRTTPYERHEQTVTGCDSLISLTLFVPQREFEVSDAICEGQEYQLGDTTLTTSGTYTRTLTGARFGCDSVVTLTLEVLPAHEEIEATICEGESYPFGGEELTEPGTYEATFVNRLGCEYTVTLTLAVTEKAYYSYEAVFCAGDIYSDENFFGLVEGGIYKDTLSSVAGCDSIIVLNLIEHEPEEVDLNIEIAEGEVYVFDNKTFDHDTTYTAHFVDQFGCDSIVTLHLTVATGLQEVLNDAQLKAAEKFMHNGILYIRANGILYDARGKRVMIRKEEE